MAQPAPRAVRTQVVGLFRDRVLLGMLILTGLAWVLFAVFNGHPLRQVQVYWAAQVPLDAALAIGAWRLRCLAAQHYQRFWSMITIAGTSFTIGDSYQFLHTVSVSGEHSTSGGTVQTAFFAVGMSSNVVACLIFPQGLRSGREKLVFWLDATTMLVAGGVMAWCFAVNPVDENTDRVTASITAALVIVAAFAATKVALIPSPPMARIAAWPMVAAPMVQGVSTFLPGPFQDADTVSSVGDTSTFAALVFAIGLLPSLLISVGPRIQELVVRIDGSHERPKRKPYSLLPYGMIALIFVIFFAMLPDRISTQLWGATAGVVVVTCLVAGRQLVAFQDNIVLIRRLDVALDGLRDQEVLLREQAATDGLTKLANRVHFTETMRVALRDMRADDRLAVLLIDLDDFKTTNDTMGHAAGDVLLVTVADRLRAAIGRDDVVARLGGDEFAVLLRGLDGAGAGRIAEHILNRLAEPMLVMDHTLATRASIGVTTARPGDEPTALLSNADIAMYEAKRRGKSTWVLYTAEMGARISAEADMIRELAEAVEAGQFSLVYQPIVRLSDLMMTGVEALIRWNHPTRGLVSPVEFIPLAERSGHIVGIGRWALQEACRQAARWRAQHPRLRNLTIGVNVAGRQLRTPNFVDEVARLLADSGLPPERLSIEVTETAVLDDEESHEAMLGLRRLGVRVALDDFGTAASSLGLLLTCPVTTLKLDRSFVESIITVRRQAAVATAVSQMANGLELASVAEGIETDEQRMLLQDLGYQYGQGYLFSRPVTSDRIVELTAASAVPVPG